MLIFVDVAYGTSGATAAAVGATAWTDPAACFETTTRVESVAEYVSGEFYRRELPPILAVLDSCPSEIEAIVVDGYVWLGDGVPGLGKRLFDALGGTTPVVGVAKTAFRTAADTAIPVLRASSTRPLWVSAVGRSPTAAADAVREMHGGSRIPSLLKRVDFLSRQRIPV